MAHAQPRRESFQESIHRLRGIGNRIGVTLVEVIFAIGVVLIGVVGLASVLPIAARRAQDAIDLNEASALASAVFDELKAKGALQFGVGSSERCRRGGAGECANGDGCLPKRVGLVYRPDVRFG